MKTLIKIGAAFLLAGCASQAELAEKDHIACLPLGPPGSDNYAQCRMLKMQQRDAALGRMSNTLNEMRRAEENKKYYTLPSPYYPPPQYR